MGRPCKEYDAREFSDLIAMGCGKKEICWFFRDDSGKPADVNTISHWCERQFGMTFAQYKKEYSGVEQMIKIRRRLDAMSEKSSAVLIFMAKNILGYSDNPNVDVDADRTEADDALTASMREEAQIILGKRAEDESAVAENA